MSTAGSARLGTTAKQTALSFEVLLPVLPVAVEEDDEDEDDEDNTTSGSVRGAGDTTTAGSRDWMGLRRRVPANPCSPFIH